MAEQILAAAGFRDDDGDGVIDVLARFQKDAAFGPHKENWRNRRMMTVAVIVTSYGCCLLMVAIWAWSVLFGDKDMPANLLNFGTTMFWAFNITATSTLAVYTGISQADTSSYRKEMAGIVKSVPQAGVSPGGNNFNGYNPNPGYSSGYGNYNQSYGGYVGADGTDTSSVPMPTPVGPDVGGPLQRKPGVIS